MNTAQRKLLDKTLGVLGWMCVAIGGGLALLILSVGILTKDVGVLNDIFKLRHEGMLIWSTLPPSIVLLWVRAFLRAGHSADQGR